MLPKPDHILNYISQPIQQIGRFRSNPCFSWCWMYPTLTKLAFQKFGGWGLNINPPNPPASKLSQGAEVALLLQQHLVQHLPEPQVLVQLRRHTSPLCARRAAPGGGEAEKAPGVQWTQWGGTPKPFADKYGAFPRVSHNIKVRQKLREFGCLQHCEPTPALKNARQLHTPSSCT